SERLWGVPGEDSVAKTEPLGESFVSRELTRAEVNASNPLIYHLKRKSPVRHLALAALRGESLTTISPLLQALESPRNSEKSRLVAAWTLGRARLNARQQEVAAGALEQVLLGSVEYDSGPILRAILRIIMGGMLLTFLFSILSWQGDW